MRRVVTVAMAAAGILAWLLRPPWGFAHVTTTNTVLFDREIVRILEVHCVACHAEGGSASPLVTYEETWLDREQILAAVLDGHMPPWAAVPGYGDFANDNGLTLRERQFIISWVEGLGPRNAGEVFLNVGGEADGGEAVQATVRSGWELGEPDLVRALGPRVVAPGAEGRVESVSVDLGLESERRASALEFEPGDPRILRSANFFLEGSGQWLGSWTPWYGFMALPEGVAYRLAPGTRVTAEIRYAASSEEVVDDGALGLHFASDPEAQPIEPSDLVLEARDVAPGPGPPRRLQAEARIDEETRVLSVLPELEPGTRSLEVSVRRSDGGTDILMFAKDFSLEWPTPYVMSEPVLVPAASSLRATAYFDTPSETPRSIGFRVRVSRY